jgi:hypothetical protein
MSNKETEKGYAEPATIDPYVKQFTPLQYYMVKSAMLELVLREQKAMQILNEIIVAKRRLLTGEGMDPDLNWTLMDEDRTAVATPAAPGVS